MTSVYTQFDYLPPGDSSALDQAAGVCTNLDQGLTQEAEAQEFATGFHISIHQARPVVDSLAGALC